MATFYSNSTNQRDPVPNLCIRDPLHSAYPDSSVPTSTFYDATNLIPLPSSMVSQSQFTNIENTISGTGQEMGAGTQFMVLNGSVVPSQGLSLSLSTQIPVPVYQYGYNPNQNSNLVSSVPNSKYLKAAKELLDEVVNVRDALTRKEEKNQSQIDKEIMDVGLKDEDPNQDKTGAELSPSERQELQNKVTKLLAMLDEVERRYKQYYHQMEVVVSSFDTIAGASSSKPYTSLALQTISRHFRALRDAITNQIQTTRKSLGELDSSSKAGGISRLRYIDQQIRQQRAMQQFGMVQQNAWRPQRGLPESSVSILRAWLFEHFLHPYPKDSEKLLLARQTGLTRSQVSNWFINARVRLWKPMIEDMYKEEFGTDPEIESNSSSENPNPTSRIGSSKEEPRSPHEETENLTSPSTAHQTGQTSQFISFSQPDICGPHQRNDIMQNDNDYSGNHHLFNDPRFLAYQMAYNGNNGNNGGVSLTLGLQHVVQGEEIYAGTVPAQHISLGGETGDFDYMNMEDRQRFGSSHLLHDFVA
ncbi:hypothetical protein LUZ60_005890 [Juncus effusus]|nr:hypothetical protein LUZ60_005890 [Juncus effusus]